MATHQSVLFVDAYDSFSQNIVALLHQELAADVTLINIDTDVRTRYDASLDDFVAHFDAIVLGPGPGNPNNPKDVGILYEVFDAAAAHQVPILGICLGFQALCVKYGLRIERMREPCHGHAKKINFVPSDSLVDKSLDIFEGIDLQNIWATCYNSLGLMLASAVPSPSSSRPGSSGTNASVSTISSQSSPSPSTLFRVLAIDQEDIVMAIRHRQLPFWGVQFHPESCKSNYECHQLIRNWWCAAKQHNLQRMPHNRRLASINKSVILRENLNTTENLLAPSAKTQQEAPNSTANLIVTKLLQASVSTTDVVQWRKLDANCNRAQIAELIHDMSINGDVVMLESTRKGRFSIYAVTSTTLFQAGEQFTELNNTLRAKFHCSEFSLSTSDASKNFNISCTREDVWTALESFMIKRRSTGGSKNVPFWGGLIGYLSYEHGLDALGVQSNGPRERNVPEIDLLWVDRSIVHDNLTNCVYIQSIRRDDEPFLDEMKSLLSLPASLWSRTKAQSSQQQQNLQAILDDAQMKLPNHKQYDAQFHQCQAELRAGNSYELCLTTGATITVDKPLSNIPYEFELYKNLHAYNPVPFGAFLKLPGITILGTSPEQFMSWSREGVIDMIPMKGTVKRSPEMTFELASEILSTPKESAENLMIADLIRHDLCSTIGPDSEVEVIKLCEVIEHETVYQLVSHIRAHAPIDYRFTDDEKQQTVIHYGLKALQQTVPPGSMTGAPKKRSCEILSHLEQRNRGLYSGVLGYMDVGGGGNWNVCIRTAFRCDSEDKERDVWHIGAGGAITVLSSAEGEWEEMMVKLNSVLPGFKKVKNIDHN